MPNSKHRIAFLITYLGKLPDYFDLWAKTCAPNHDTCHWFVYNDHVKEKTACNKAVTLIPYTFGELCRDMALKTGIRIPEQNTRIVCDCRVMLYLLRREKEKLDEFDFIGYSDLDVVYGRISRFLPDNAESFALISAHEKRPCGPFTLFNREYLPEILSHPRIKAYLEHDFGKEMYDSKIYSQSGATFTPVAGNSQKDRIIAQTSFSHLDESEELVEIAKQFGPVHCAADPLQPTMCPDSNHRKAFALWQNGKLMVRDNIGRKREGAFFHFSRFKNRTRFKINPAVLPAENIGIYKYGITEIKSPWTVAKMMLTLLY